MSGGTSASRRQKRMGPAPFASFEDLSDELESPDDKGTAVVRLPGIREDVTPTNTPIPMDPTKEYGGISLVGAVAAASPATTSKLQAPSGTPRIDISRASSSSHHDSKDSSPERELFEAHDPTSAKLGLGFREEGALDLRSSTEELDFHDPQDANSKKKGKPRAQSPSSELHQHQRKDSSTSEIGLLSISGRTSRLSSIGSQGSAQSRLSNASHLSVLSGQSGLSRSPSPHKMLLETSFCGTKHPPKSGTVPVQGTKVESETLEKVLLSRKHDPTEAVMAEGIETQPRKEPAPVKPSRKVASDITIKVEEPQTVSSNKIPKKIISKSGVEYIYIPLKGPLPIDDENHPREVRSASHAVIRTKEAVLSRGAKSATPSPQKREEEPKYIRIRLKPDYMYSQEDDSSKAKPDTLDLSNEQQQPSTSYAASIELKASPKLPRQNLIKEVGSKTPSPSLSRKSSFASLFRSKETIISPESPTVPAACRRKNTISGILRDAGDKVRERSRSRSKSRERDKEKSLSAAPSSTESIDSKTKQKSMFSIFKSSSTKKVSSGSEKKSEEPLEALKLEFRFNDSKHEAPLQCDSIRIPLHSPTHYDGEQGFEEDLVAQGLVAQTSRQLSLREQSFAAEKQHEQNLIEQSLVEQAIHQSIEQSIAEGSILQNVKTSSQDSQDTVIEAPIHRVQAIVEVEPKSNRQSSTSSENVVFSTKLGSEGGNEIFTTKLPKDKSDSAKNGAVPKDRVTNGEIEEVMHVPRTTSSLSVGNLEAKEPETLITSVTSIDDGNSSESERGSELDFSKNKKEDLKLDLDYLEPERKNLVLQDSYEDELPYVPTTLPQEQSAIIPIVPIKQRSTFEMKTIPIERPRSTTPINPSCLEEYCEEVMGAFNSKAVTETIEKLKISLPRHDSIKSPRKPAGNTTNWFEFAEKGLRRSSQDDTPPPLPPKGVQKEWINFEEIPERRKPPKKIQTLPSRGHIEVPESVLQDNVVYNYVNPEECKCECHEITARGKDKTKGIEPPAPAEDELPLLVDEEVEEEKPKTLLGAVVASDRRSVISDSSVDLSISIEPAPETTGGVALRTPFTSDLSVSSNRSSIVSQDEPHSPDSGSPNAFPKTF